MRPPATNWARRFSRLLLVAFVAPVLALPAAAAPAVAEPSVVATAYPLFEAASSVGGSKLHISDLLPADPSGPVSADKARQLRTASLAIVLGQGVQPAVDAVVAQRTGPTLRVLDRFAAEEGQTSVQADPYVWENPQQMAQIVDDIRIAVTSLDAADGRRFQRNATTYGFMLAGVDGDYARTMATCRRHDLLTEDPRFATLARRYGLVVHNAAPADLAATAKRLRATTVFKSTLPSVPVARQIQRDAGVRVAVMDPLIAQTDQARRGGSNYDTVMELNLDALRGALGCASKTPKER